MIAKSPTTPAQIAASGPLSTVFLGWDECRDQFAVQAPEMTSVPKRTDGTED